MTYARWIKFLLISMILFAAGPTQAINQDFSIKLLTGTFEPAQVQLSTATGASLAGKHIIVQLSGPVTDNQKAALEEAGIDLHGYIPNYAFIARSEQALDAQELEALGVRWVGLITPDQKVSPELIQNGFREYSRHGFNKVQMIVIFHEDADPKDWLIELRNNYEAEIIGVNPIGNSVDLILPESRWAELATIEAVQWVEQALPEPVELNNNCRSYTGAAITHTTPYNLSGNGVVVAEWDGGRADASHFDLGARVTSMDYAPYSTHATHVAGTVMGSGASRSDLRYKGMAPEAELLTHLWWGSSSEMATEYGVAINDYNARIATNSWGYGVSVSPSGCLSGLGGYSSACLTIDRLVRGYVGEPISIAWSAGNERSTGSDYCGSIGFTFNTIGALATSKNIITVGAVSAYTDYMTSFSSWGPTDDGRIKPDVCGPGYSVTSCKPGSGYTTMSGTSMSTPAIAGLLALMYEQRDIYFGSPVLPSTMKGILINTAEDMGRVGPDYEYGHGKVNVVTAVDKIAFGEPSYVEAEISTGETHIYDLTVPGNADRLKVTIVWDDPGGYVSASEHLINNIDIELIDPFSTVWYPWVLYKDNPSSPAIRAVDAINNVETAEIPDPIAGLWKAKVTGFNIPDGPQKYSLIFTPDNINTPGNLTAVAVYDDGDIEINPGATTTLNYYISNIGANPDSFSISISGDPIWLNETVDTLVYLAPYDSVLVTTSATVPATAQAGDNTAIQCRAINLSDTLAVGIDFIVVSSAQTFGVIASTNVIEETVNSPDIFDFQITISNTGNSSDMINIIATGETDWTFVPESLDILVAYDQDTIINMQAIIPAEVVNGSDNLVTITAITSGGPQSITTFNLVCSNPYFPPSLISPASPAYVQDATPIFTWAADGDSCAIYIANDSLITNIVVTLGGIISNSIELPPAESLAEGVYYWGVRKYIGPDSSSLQRFPFKLLIDNTPPASRNAVAPVGPKRADSTFNFYWTVAPGDPIDVIAPEYNILTIASDPAMTTDLLVIEPINSQSYFPPEALEMGRWYWSVKSADSAGNTSTPSNVLSYVLDNEAPAIPIELIPLDSIAVADDTILFTWNIGPQPPYETSANYYYLHISNNPGFGDYSTFADFVHTDSVRVDATAFEEFSTYWWRVKAMDSAGYYSDYSTVHTFSYGIGLCGDLNDDTMADLADITMLIAYVYLGGPPPLSLSIANVNCDSWIDLADVTKLIDHVYISKEPLCCSEPE